MVAVGAQAKPFCTRNSAFGCLWFNSMTLVCMYICGGDSEFVFTCLFQWVIRIRQVRLASSHLRNKLCKFFSKPISIIACRTPVQWWANYIQPL